MTELRDIVAVKLRGKGADFGGGGHVGLMDAAFAGIVPLHPGAGTCEGHGRG